MIRNIALLTTFFVTGCSTVDFQATQFRLEQSSNTESVYEYKAFADAMYPLKSKDAEQQRIQWLEKWLAQNGLSDNNYEITDREVYLKSKGWFGDIYDIYYTVEVPTN